MKVLSNNLRLNFNVQIYTLTNKSQRNITIIWKEITKNWGCGFINKVVRWRYNLNIDILDGYKYNKIYQFINYKNLSLINHIINFGLSLIGYKSLSVSLIDFATFVWLLSLKLLPIIITLKFRLIIECLNKMSCVEIYVYVYMIIGELLLIKNLG